MKKIAYLSIENISSDGLGVEGKIFKQISELKKHGFLVDFVQYDIKRESLRKIASNIPLVNTKKNREIINKISVCDYLYIRYFLSDFNMVYILKEIKKKNPNIKIISEIPTYPYDFEFSRKSVSLILDKINRKRFSSFFDRIVTFSDDEVIYGVKTLRISNGVDIEKINKKRARTTFKDIELIAVARIDFWHGYDRIIEGLKKYYDSGGKEDIIIHIVGDGKDCVINELKQLVGRYSLSERVIFHGRQSGDYLNELYDRSSIGIDTLGRHRTNISYNSTLKGKEYLAKGIPIISGVRTEMDMVKSFKYYFRVPADDTAVDFFKIVDYYHDVYDNEDELKIINEIREFCEKNFSFDITFKKIINEILKM